MVFGAKPNENPRYGGHISELLPCQQIKIRKLIKILGTDRNANKAIKSLNLFESCKQYALKHIEKGLRLNITELHIQT